MERRVVALAGSAASDSAMGVGDKKGCDVHVCHEAGEQHQIIDSQNQIIIIDNLVLLAVNRKLVSE